MAQKTYYINGLTSWAKLNKENYDKKFKSYVMDLYLPDDQVEEFQKWSSELELRDATTKGFNDKVGPKHWIKLRRPTVKLIKDKVVTFDPPKLLDKDGESELAKDTNIGNGSDVTCKVVVFDTVKGKGVRLEVVRVNELVEYEGEEVDESNVDSPF